MILSISSETASLSQNADGSHTLYDSEGKKLLDLNSRVEANEKVIVERSETNSGCRIYDENGTEISKSGESIYLSAAPAVTCIILIPENMS